MSLETDLHDAIEAARNAGINRPLISATHVRYVLLAVLMNLPDEATVREIRDELEAMELRP